jgi:hypothetical protein
MPTPDDFELPVINPKPHKPGTFGRGNPPPGKGRLKGTVNKVTRDLKNGIVDAAIALGRNGEGEGGLQGYLQFLGWHHPKAFASLLGKILPLQVTGDGLPGTTIGTVNVISVPADHYLSAEDIEKMRPTLEIEHAPEYAVDEPASQLNHEIPPVEIAEPAATEPPIEPEPQSEYARMLARARASDGVAWVMKEPKIQRRWPRRPSY